jgi:hypothetical protein
MRVQAVSVGWRGQGQGQVCLRPVFAVVGLGVSCGFVAGEGGVQAV